MSLGASNKIQYSASIVDNAYTLSFYIVLIDNATIICSFELQIRDELSIMYRRLEVNFLESTLHLQSLST